MKKGNYMTKVGKALWLLGVLMFATSALIVIQRPTVFPSIARIGLFPDLLYFQIHVISLLLLIVLSPAHGNKLAAAAIVLLCSFLVFPLISKLLLTVGGLSFENYNSLVISLALILSGVFLVLAALAVRNISSTVALFSVLFGTCLSSIPQAFFLLKQVQPVG